jgi:hypothetical protein
MKRKYGGGLARRVLAGLWLMGLLVGCAHQERQAECHGPWVPVNPTAEAGHG